MLCYIKAKLEADNLSSYGSRLAKPNQKCPLNEPAQQLHFQQGGNDHLNLTN